MADALALAMAAVYAAGSIGTIVASAAMRWDQPLLPRVWSIIADGTAAVFWPLIVTFTTVREFWR
jgi:hypothetical protein